jgi:hypothetical protein
MKSFREFFNERCWTGYKPVPGKKAYTKGSCTKEEVRYTIEVYELDEESNNQYTHVFEMQNEFGEDVDVYLVAESDQDAETQAELLETAAWQRKEGKSEKGGLNKKGIASYRRENPGSKLSMAVTTKPSKLKAGSKAANRRKSFCARMSGMKKRLTSAATARDPDSRINKSLRKWNC